MRCLMLLAVAAGVCSLMAQPAPPAGGGQPKVVPDLPFEGTRPAPDFPENLDWLNTDRPLALADLRGKVVLLDFWTYCCINCIHVVPDLKKLEAKYAKELVVIGVHSAKFDNEKLTDNIREAIKRYEIEHPVINDRDFQVWRSYGARAWPTLILINPQGRIIGGHSGEGIFDLFDQVIAATIAHFDPKGLIDRRPIEFALEKDKAPRTVLSYPGKVVADTASKRLFFTDSNHNRVIIASLGGEILEIIGTGAIGLEDGPFEAAEFFRPQGLWFDAERNSIYVADTENHAIRQIDLEARTVKTLAGTGRQARRFNQQGRGVDLNSPWDLMLVGSKLYIAMAGPHQLWTLDLESLEAKVFAGTGRENITDGPLLECALAQPSGITFDGEKLYFADSEVSAVRSAELSPEGQVRTLIGQGLFEFGDVDGRYPEARLQHCLGVAYHDGFVYVADTYNHKIKKLDPKTKELATFLGTGKRGRADGPAKEASLNEPSGLCFAEGKLFIADANNHLIRVCDLSSMQVSTLEWRGLEKLAQRVPDAGKNAERKLELHRLSPSSSKLEFRISLPRGTKLNPAAPSSLKIRSDDPDVVQIRQPERKLEQPDVTVEVGAKAGQTTLKVELAIQYCDAKNAGLCYFEDVTLIVPVEVTEAGDRPAVVRYALEFEHAPITLE